MTFWEGIKPLKKPLRKMREEKKKQYWIIKNKSTGEVTKNNDGTIMFFEYVSQAISMIQKHKSNSPYLRVVKWKKSKNTH